MIVLGKRYKDSVTGLEGTCVGVYHRLHGSSQAEIAPDFVKGQPAAIPQWVEEDRLVKTSDSE